MTNSNYNEEVNENENEALDFDLEDEYKPAPLIPDGTYPGAITSATFNGLQLSFQVTFNDTQTFLTDGESSVDGAILSYNVWFPKAGDDQVLIKSGTMSKKQWKINNAKEVGDKLGININTRTIINESISNGDWIGIPVHAKVAIKDDANYGIRNEISQLTKR